MSSSHWTAETAESWKITENDKEIHVSAKALNITWGNDPRFWRWTNLLANESPFKVGAELLQVNWIEVHGKMDLNNFKEGETYEIFYVVKFKVDAFGWHSSPIKFRVMSSTGEKHLVSKTLEAYREVTDKLHEIQGGEFTVPNGQKGSVSFGMFETESDWWKGSMILEGVKFKPKPKM